MAKAGKEKKNKASRSRKEEVNPLLGKKLIEVPFSSLPVGALFALNSSGIDLFKKISVPKKYKGRPCPHNARRKVYGNPTLHIGLSNKVWTTKKELEKGKDLYEETLRRG